MDELRGILQEGSLHGFDCRGKILAEHIWLGANASNGTDLHNKTRVLLRRPQDASEVEWWTHETPEGDLLLRPRALFADPLRGGDHVIVLCDCMSPPCLDPHTGHQLDSRPHYTNNRAPFDEMMSLAAASAPQFTVRQEYFMMNRRTGWPLGWSCKGTPAGNTSSVGPIGLASSPGRLLAEAHLRACLHAGVKISDTEDSIPGKWMYTVGPCQGVEAGDHLWASRYLMMRLAEKYELQVSFDPKPVPGDWPGAACHVEMSTAETRAPQSGWYEIERQIHLLAETHFEHLLAYGVGNSRRLHPASSQGPCGGGGGGGGGIPPFTWGVGDRGASVHVPVTSLVHRCGGYEDRRPGASMDPYLVLMMLVSSALRLPLPRGNGEGSNRSSRTALQPLLLGRTGGGMGMLGSTPPQNYGLLGAAAQNGGSSHGVPSPHQLPGTLGAAGFGAAVAAAAAAAGGHGGYNNGGYNNANAGYHNNGGLGYNFGAGAGPQQQGSGGMHGGGGPAFTSGGTGGFGGSSAGRPVSPSHSRVDSLDELLEGEDLDEEDLEGCSAEWEAHEAGPEASSHPPQASGQGMHARHDNPVSFRMVTN